MKKQNILGVLQGGEEIPTGGWRGGLTIVFPQQARDEFTARLIAA